VAPGEETAHDAFREALGKIAEQCVHIHATFEEAVEDYTSRSADDMEEI